GFRYRHRGRSMTISFALTTLWHDRQRFLAGVLAVAFSALLIALQCGLLLGMFSFASLPVDHTRAQVWVGCPEVASVDLGRPIRESRTCRASPVNRKWSAVKPTCRVLPTGSSPMAVPSCMVIGSRLEDGSLGAMRELTSEVRDLLSEPGAVVVDE